MKGRSELRPILKAAQRLEKYKGKVHLNKDKLISDGVAYAVRPRNNLHELPEELSPVKRSERTNPMDDTLIFFDRHRYLSNLNPCEIYLNGLVYSWAEQYIQASKARLFDNDESEQLILYTDDPVEMKRLGRHVKNYNRAKWELNMEQICYVAEHAKYKRNEGLRKFLIDTGDLQFGETSSIRKLPYKEFAIFNLKLKDH